MKPSKSAANIHHGDCCPASATLRVAARHWRLDVTTTIFPVWEYLDTKIQMLSYKYFNPSCSKLWSFTLFYTNLLNYNTVITINAIILIYIILSRNFKLVVITYRTILGFKKTAVIIGCKKKESNADPGLRHTISKKLFLNTAQIWLRNFYDKINFSFIKIATIKSKLMYGNNLISNFIIVFDLSICIYFTVHQYIPKEINKRRTVCIFNSQLEKSHWNAFLWTWRTDGAARDSLMPHTRALASQLHPRRTATRPQH